MIAVVVLAALFVVLVALGLLSYRRTLGTGTYEGTFGGAFGVGTLLGVFLGLSVGVLTLLIVLIARQLR